MAKLRITYRTERAPDEVMLGAFSQIAAKRRFGLDACRDENGDPEVALFGCFVEIEGPAAAKDSDAFDAWLYTVESFEILDRPADGTADPTPAETPPTPS